MLKIITIVICNYRRYIVVIYRCVSCTTFYTTIYIYIVVCIFLYIIPYFVEILSYSFFFVVVHIFHWFYTFDL